MNKSVVTGYEPPADNCQTYRQEIARLKAELEAMRKDAEIKNKQAHENGITAGIVYCVGYLISEQYDWQAEALLREAGITPDEDLSFCSEYDLPKLERLSYWKKLKGE